MELTEADVLEATREWFDDPDAAITVLTRFLATDPHSTKVRSRLAMIYTGGYGEDVPGAERLYREILREDPNNIIALSGLGLLQGNPGSDVLAEESLELLSKAAELSGEPWAIENLANKLWDTDRRDEAAAVLSRLENISRGRELRDWVDRARRSVRALHSGRLGCLTGYTLPDK